MLILPILLLKSDPFFLQHLLKLLILSFQLNILLLQHVHLISIDNRLVLDIHSLRCIFQCIKTLLIVELGWAYTCYHVCICVATQSILKDSC